MEKTEMTSKNKGSRDVISITLEFSLYLNQIPVTQIPFHFVLLQS